MRELAAAAMIVIAADASASAAIPASRRSRDLLILAHLPLVPRLMFDALA